MRITISFEKKFFSEVPFGGVFIIGESTFIKLRQVVYLDDVNLGRRQGNAIVYFQSYREDPPSHRLYLAGDAVFIKEDTLVEVECPEFY